MSRTADIVKFRRAKAPIILLSLLFLNCCAAHSDNAPVRMRLEGSLTMAGNVPFNFLVLRAKDGKSYEIKATEAKALSRLQDREITLEGTVRRVELRTADGRFTREKNLLSDVKVVRGGD